MGQILKGPGQFYKDGSVSRKPLGASSTQSLLSFTSVQAPAPPWVDGSGQPGWTPRVAGDQGLHPALSLEAHSRSGSALEAPSLPTPLPSDPSSALTPWVPPSVFPQADAIPVHKAAQLPTLSPPNALCTEGRRP